MIEKKKKVVSSPDLLIAVKIEQSDQAELRETLNIALEQGHIWPAFQPVTDMNTGNISGFEVLARWSDPEMGDISPVVFIPRLEQHNLIEAFSDALMTQACHMAANWPGKFSLAFNVSPLQLAATSFAQKLMDIAYKTRFPLNRIEIEVTESSLFSDTDHAYARLNELDKLGIKIGIDDFGTGYSNLARLEAFPFHKIKVDARFVRNLDRDPAKRRIAAAVIGLGQSLGITTVAEGIETEAAEAILQNYGCDLGQGWLYGKGEPGEQARLRLWKQHSFNHLEKKPLDFSPFQRLHQINSIYNQVPVGLCFLDTDLRYVRTNERFASIHGLTPAELRGKSLYDILQGEQLKQSLAALERTRYSDDACEENYIFLGKHIKILHSRIFDDGGECIGFSIFSIDMTEENRIKRQVIEERDYANAILDSLPDIFYHYDKNAQLKRWNQNLEKVTGYTSEELEQFNPLNFVPDNQRESLTKAVFSVFNDGLASIEANLLLKDGSYIPYLFTGKRFHYNGEKGFVGIGTDISQRQKMEQILRDKNSFLESFINAAPNGIFILDPNGKLIVYNEKLTQQFGKFYTDINTEGLIKFIDNQIKTPHDFSQWMVNLLNNNKWVGIKNIQLSNNNAIKIYSAPLHDKKERYHGRLWIFYSQ